MKAGKYVRSSFQENETLPNRLWAGVRSTTGQKEKIIIAHFAIEKLTEAPRGSSGCQAGDANAASTNDREIGGPCARPRVCRGDRRRRGGGQGRHHRHVTGDRRIGAVFKVTDGSPVMHAQDLSA